MQRANLLDRKAISPTTGDVPVAADVLLHNLPRLTLEALREAVEQGLTPAALDFVGDDNSTIVVIRFTRPPGKARVMVSVEFYPENNEVVGKIYDAESEVKHATERRDAHLAGSVRATVSRLLRELAAKVAGDPSF